MQPLSSNILSINYTSIPDSQIVVNLEEAQHVIESKVFDVIVWHINSNTPPNALRFLQHPASTQLVLIYSNKTEIETFLQMSARLNIFGIYSFSNTYQIKEAVLSAVEKSQKFKQEKVLEGMVQDLNRKLEKSFKDLEERVEKRQAYLLEARKKTFLAQTKWELTRQTLIAIHQGITLHSIESGLMESLKYIFHLKSIRIVLHPLIAPNRQTLVSLRIPLVKNQEILGTVVFYRDEERPFAKEEADFLSRLSEAISLSVDRLKKLEQTYSLREQWQTTFNAVSDPIALINEKYQVIQSNHAYDRLRGKQQTQTCYESLFQRKTKCDNCHLGSSFRTTQKLERTSHWDVQSQKVNNDPDYGTIFINLYHDVTSQVEVESKIVESARLAEIGTIGGSIAHELNNPLAGILSLVQLIKMDLRKEDPIYSDIEEMEKGVFRCREIIENLLNFSRDPSSDKISEFNLSDALNRAIKIMELQTKSKGIEIKLDGFNQPIPFKGNFNLLSEAFRNVLQNCIESVVQKQVTDKKSRAEISLNLQLNSDSLVISVTDNGLGAVSSSTLSQSIATQIIRDHKGEINFNHLGPEGMTTIISLPRLVF